MRDQESLRGRETADAVVIGGGVAGLSVARALAQRGVKRVTLIERAGLGAEASCAAAGMLAAQVEADQADDFLALACASRDLYPAFSEALREETGIDIELERTGTLYLAFTEADAAEMAHRYEWQSRAGLSVERLSADEARRLEPCISPRVRGALRFPLDGQVENRRLVAALAVAVEKCGVRLLTGTNVEALRIERGRINGVLTAQGAIEAPVVVVAGGAWASLLGAASSASSSSAFTNSLSGATDSRAPDIRIEPVRGQMLCFEARPRLHARHVIYSPRGYIVPRLDGRVLAGSTTEHAGYDKRVTCEGLNTITTHAVEIAPAVGELPLLDSWAGLRPRAADGWPVLGGCAEVRGLYYAAGHYRNGILLAPVTGDLLAEEILSGRASPRLTAFSPDRFQCVGVN